MSDFVKRLERELVAASERAISRRSGTRSWVAANGARLVPPSRALGGMAVIGVAVFVAGGALLLHGRRPPILHAAQTAATPTLVFLKQQSGRESPAHHAVVGVLENPASRHPKVVAQVSSPAGAYAANWLSHSKLLVQTAFSLRESPGQLYQYSGGKLTLSPADPLRAGDNTYKLSPDGQFIAIEPWRAASCGAGARAKGCISARREVWVERSDGSHRRLLAHGLLEGWSPEGAVIVSNGSNREFSTAVYRAVSLDSGAGETVLSSANVARFAHVPNVQLGGIAYSGTGRYLAAMVLLNGLSMTSHAPHHGEEQAIVVARSNGRILRLIRAPTSLSMIAWSPSRDQLAYTSGRNSPWSRLALLASPTAQPRTLAVGRGPFSWVSWSPSSRALLLDEPAADAWRLFKLTPSGTLGATRRLRRFGSEPTWCCVKDNTAGG